MLPPYCIFLMLYVKFFWKDFFQLNAKHEQLQWIVSLFLNRLELFQSLKNYHPITFHVCSLYLNTMFLKGKKKHVMWFWNVVMISSLTAGNSRWQQRAPPSTAITVSRKLSFRFLLKIHLKYLAKPYF